jgi:hypothetical protein
MLIVLARENPNGSMILQYGNNLIDFNEPSQPFVLAKEVGYKVLGLAPIGFVRKAKNMQVEMINGIERRDVESQPFFRILSAGEPGECEGIRTDGR